MKKLSFQWRITLASAALLVITCVILSFAISRFAVLQFDQIENGAIEVRPFGQNGGTLGFDMAQILPQVSEQLASAKTAFVMQSVLWTAVVALASMVATYFLAGRMLVPLRRITGQMAQIEAQNLSQRLEQPEQEDEIYDMIHSFNRMLTRLETSFTAQRQFSANAAHELRTPLAVMRTRLEVLQKSADASPEQLEGVLATVTHQSDRLARLVELLLEMTELQAVERSDRVDLQALVEEIFCDLADIAEQRHVSLSQLPGGCEVPGSDPLLYRAVYNLVENAIRHGGQQGAVTVGVSSDGPFAVLTVSDTGAGIEPALWDSLFLPFFRADGSRSRRMGGAGLGLALVREIAEVHGGSVAVAGSSPAGTSMQLSLPRYDGGDAS